MKNKQNKKEVMKNFPRMTWNRSPVSKIKESSKVYKRNRRVIDDYA